jgi:hypothetical protein
LTWKLRKEPNCQRKRGNRGPCRRGPHRRGSVFILKPQSLLGKDRTTKPDQLKTEQNIVKHPDFFFLLDGNAHMVVCEKY